MSIVERHDPGTFSWVELLTPDAASARDFYTRLFGWEVEETPLGDGSFYYMFRKPGGYTGAMHQPPPSSGITPHWASYVTVASADETAARARELGASVLMEPFDVFDAGRMAVIQDPTGATFSVWEPRRHIGVEVMYEPGTPCWNELATRDTDRAREFYTRLFGWTTIEQDSPIRYTSFMRGDQPAGGMYPLTAEMAGVPPHWMVYFAVEDCDASAERARELGARVQVEPTDIPGVGRFSLLADPQGAMFSLVKLLPMPAAVPTAGATEMPPAI